MPLSSSEIRKLFLDYFKRRKHTVVASSSLIPAGDPTLLFTNAGMVQFKETFLGRDKREYVRATTAQRCLRVSGKHNDLENVGPSTRHHTLFEMLGNFSFGDYFKREAIGFAWDLLVNHYELDRDRLWFTVFEGDSEVPPDDDAVRFWEEAGASPDRVLRFGRHENFWSMGDTGPCGPCSEIHYYRGERPKNPKYNRADLVNGSGEETVEIWNLVFMQFNRSQVGENAFKMTPLPRPSVDTGAGLERLTAVLQGKTSNYETDLFKPIMERTRKLLDQDKTTMGPNLSAYRVIADHARAIAFLIADGVVPSNEGRGYVLRMILRRAARHGQMIGFNGPFLGEILPTVIQVMGEAYPELVQRRPVILKTTLQEEERFQATLKTGSALLDELIADVQARGQSSIAGAEAFKLHDTYGFGIELTRDAAREHGLTVDEAGFTRAMAAQADRSRAASNIGLVENAGDKLYRDVLAELRSSSSAPDFRVAYDPYSRTLVETSVVGILLDGHLVSQAQVGDKVELILPSTCFYVESGGQVSDTGRIVRYTGAPDGSEVDDESVLWAIEVTDARHPIPELVVHVGTVLKGTPRVGDAAVAEVEQLRRWDIMRNHTATHLLHRELRYTLGEHVQQAGSLVAPERLRFDFSHTAMLTQDELDTIEQAVNDAVLADFPVAAFEMAYKDAVAGGAMALFTEKYGDRVRVLKVGDPTRPFSQELCGGTHVNHTSQIGMFHILSESSTGSGVRRIEAVTGHGAGRLLQEGLGRLDRTAAYLRVSPEQVDHRVLTLMNENEAQRKEIERLRREVALRDSEKLLERVQQLEGVRILAAQVDAANADILREMSDWFRERLGSGIVVLGAAIEGKPSLIVAVTPDLVSKGYNAGELIRPIARIVGGGGGGRPNLAQAGGKDVNRLAEAIASAPRLVTKA
ncbi:MAG: alanine--tRNA ligase [Chloroflexi bacterium]|nr:alanine--tRNA ligase [Chloroflexota bacterium]